MGLLSDGFRGTRRPSRSRSEQGTLDAIMKACDRSETLRCVVDERNSEVSNKSVDDILEELEKEMANNDLNLIEDSAESSKG
jgi:hypothetical protein